MPTRPRGLVKRKNGVWYDRRAGDNGADRWRSLRTTDYQTALQTFKSSDGTQEVAPGTIAELGAAWVRIALPTQRNEKNVRMADARWTKYTATYLGHIETQRLAGDDVREFRQWLDRYRQKRGKGKHGKRRPLQPRTVLFILQDLGACLDWAVESKRIKVSPFPKKVLPSVQETAPEPFNAEEMKTLLAMPEPFRFAIRLIVSTGLRWAEACRALRTDITPDGWLVVQHRTKNRRVRRVPLGREILTECLKRKGRLLEPFLEDNPGLFSRAVVRRTKVKRFGPQRLKDTFACNFLSAGGNQVALQLILGHQDPKTTQRYGRPSDNFIKGEMERALATAPVESVAHLLQNGFGSSVSRTVQLVESEEVRPCSSDG